MRVALLFIDGVGMGARDPSVNPLANRDHLLSQFADGTGAPLPPEGHLTPLDATFGIGGRPQSATNQTAMLTGEAAPMLLGRHTPGFPNPRLRSLLEERSIVRRLVEAGRTATFVNSYPAGYLDALGVQRRPSRQPDVEIPEKYRRRLRPSATTLAFAAAGVPLRTLDDARSGEGLTNDIDGERANERGFEVPRRTPEQAAEVFWSLARQVDFALFEHYLADEAGHQQDRPAAERALASFDRFARAVVASRPTDAQVLICSDHGNVEDLAARNHTRNPVALLSFGPRPPAGARTVADLAGYVLSLLGVA